MECLLKNLDRSITSFRHMSVSFVLKYILHILEEYISTTCTANAYDIILYFHCLGDVTE